MPIFKLRKKGRDLSNAELIEASKTKLDLEKYLESWLEQSPWAIAQEPILIIGRQSTASLEDRNIFPDLLGLDKDGNIVIVELKKGRTPRGVVAQLLEYASWANDLSDDEIHDIASQYFLSNTEYKDKSLRELFLDIFETDEIPSFNSRLRMFIASEQISPSTSRICRFLRMEHGVDVNCIEFSIYQTESGEILVSSQVVVGQEEVTRPRKPISDRWSGDKPVKLVVWEAVQELTKGDKEQLFSPKEVTKVVLSKYPNFNKSSVGCQIMSDCVNHTSRHHYPGGDEHYWWVEKGKYRLFNPGHDNVEE